jgi:hypothetical protein
MEAMATEKAQLAQSLATEKDALLTSNQSLSDQLQQCFKQLQETSSLLENEQEMNFQLEASRMAVEDEKNQLAQSLSDRERENNQLATTILRLEAALEKERAAAADLQQSLSEQHEQLESLQGDLQYAIKSRDVLESERDELQHAMTVVTEERDTARLHEEELFDKLTDVTNDLETLQESYVDMGERCNNAQDEAEELRDQVLALQETLNRQRANFLATTAVSTLKVSSQSTTNIPAVVATSVVTAAESVSEPKSSSVDPQQLNSSGSHKRSGSKSLTSSGGGGLSQPPQPLSQPQRSLLEHNLERDGDKLRFVSVDDSKTTSKRAVDEEDYQEDFDDFQDE